LLLSGEVKSKHASLLLTVPGCLVTTWKPLRWRKL